MDIKIGELVSTEEVKKKIKSFVEEEMADKVKWALGDSISEQVDEFMKKEIVPEIIKELKKNKTKIIEQLENMIIKLVSELAESMIAIVTKNIEEPYHVKDMVKKLFDIY